MNDGLAFALAESQPGSLLLTGDGLLRSVATGVGIEVHGALWVIDQLHEHGVENAATLADAVVSENWCGLRLA